MSEFHFLRPYWLLALFPLAWLSLRLLRAGRVGGDWRRICDPALLPYVLMDDGGGATAQRSVWLFAAGGALAILALAGPAWDRLPLPAFRNEAALVIALDLSRAMDASDIKPSRLERARFKIADILKERKDGLTALLVYSGDAFTVTPLTDDVATIHSQLSALNSDLMPVQGDRADRALELAGRLLRQAGLTRGDILLVTPGVNPDRDASAAKTLAAEGYRVSALGAGAEEGAPTPLPRGGFLQDGKGNIVITRLAAQSLARLAEEGGGIYRKIATNNADLADLNGFFGDRAVQGANTGTGNGVSVEQWRERGPWLLLLLLPLGALAFRRGYLPALLLLFLPWPEPARALDWQALWRTPDQRASRALAAGDPAKAAETFEDPAWKAAAQYQAGQFKEAAKTLKEQNTPDAKYNLGNALARQGRYPQAIAAYDQALKQDPHNEDARYNKELVEKAMRDQEKRKQQEQNQSGQDQDPSPKQQQQDQKKDQTQDGKPQQDRSDQKQSDSGDKDRKDGQEQGSDGEPKQNQNPDRRQGEAQGDQKQEGDQLPEDQKPPNRQAERADAELDSPAERELRGDEDRQANEQWLRRIPDDPGGLLRRKFEYQYKQRQERRE